MLLSVEPFDDSIDGTLLDLWFIGGGHKVVRPPVPPHYWLDQEQGGDCTFADKRLLSNPDRTVGLYRVDFPSLANLERYRHSESLESHKRYVDVLISEHGFAMPSVPPSVLSWDIESFCFSPVAPDPRRDTVRSIAVWYRWDDYAELEAFVANIALAEDAVVQWDVASGEVGLSWRVSEDHDEDWVIRQFLRMLKSLDPDVVAGFNDSFYDIPLLLTRCAALRIPCVMGRDGSPPYILTRMYERRGRIRQINTVRIRGRVHLDVYGEVALDQTLYDLKGRGQVEVARHFGFAPIEGVHHGRLTDDNVCEINVDDARCCFGLAGLYMRNIMALSEELSVPLNLMVERSPSHIPNWFYGQEYAKLGIVSDGFNYERFESIFSRGGKPYEGALVKMFKWGLFRNVVHTDFSSFYPSIMIEYNLSPETVFLVKTTPYTGEYKFEKHSDYWIVEVPDIPKLKGKPDMEHGFQYICRIDMRQDGVTKKKLIEFRKKREVLKHEYDKTKDEKLQSQQYALKVIQNTLYGYCGTPYALYGNILVAILITALARYHIQEEMERLRHDGYSIIEVDTDGFYAVKGAK